MLEAFNDVDSVDIEATSKNVHDMRATGRDLRLCIRNVQVFYDLHGYVPTHEDLPHSPETVAVAVHMVSTLPCLGIERRVRDYARRLYTRAQEVGEGVYYGVDS